MGGQTALNIVRELNKEDYFSSNPIKILGASPRSIDVAEDRELFAQAMAEIGLETPFSIIVDDTSDLEKISLEVTYSLILRPFYTLGGSGGCIVFNKDEFLPKVRNAIDLSPVSKTLVEESLIGWKELTEHIRIWDYTTQFTNFLAPFPNIQTLQPNIKFFRDNHATWVFEQHSHHPSELFELRSYLTAKLLWNPDLDADEIITEFT